MKQPRVVEKAGSWQGKTLPFSRLVFPGGSKQSYLSSRRTVLALGLFQDWSFPDGGRRKRAAQSRWKVIILEVEVITFDLDCGMHFHTNNILRL